MSDKIIDLKDAAKPLLEEYAQELGRRLPKMLLELESWLLGRGLKVPAEAIAAAKRALAKAPKELIQIATGVVQVPRKIFPSGEFGDVLCRYANAAFDQFGRGASEKPKLDGLQPEGRGDAAVPINAFLQPSDVVGQKVDDQPPASVGILERIRRQGDEMVDLTGDKLDKSMHVIRDYAAEFDDMVYTRQLKRRVRLSKLEGSALRYILTIFIPALALIITILLLNS